MMSMKSEAKPVSFVEDCAVPLHNLAEYTQGLTDIFDKYQTSGTWYAHASVGCLHVRPVLNMKDNKDIIKMRSIATEAFELVKNLMVRTLANTEMEFLAQNLIPLCLGKS